ncbi:glycerol-3-phosphate dehydrogenase [Methylocella sp.]|uniref:glycerol-3-phosphate dehydrogenase n=1 Tax=Methylocella sp. TaxID=1978226 RepID=UPI003783D12F
MARDATQDMPDLLVVGGGVNGAGLARDAAGRGLAVLLVEQDDLAAHTSSSSTKLIHGGLRYLEHCEFRLVREALLERERLLAIAPHVIAPLRFVLPHDVRVRPAWLVRTGLFLYDHLASRKRLPASTRIDLSRDPRGAPLNPLTRVGFEYSDCSADDARLVVLNALDARERGADIRVGVRLESARREGGVWAATLRGPSGETQAARARILVNAAGPWVSDVLDRRLGLGGFKRVRLVRGGHIVTPRLYEGAHAYVLQNPDRRVVFAIPYQDDFTLVGTTEVPHDAPCACARVSADEVEYLVATINRWFRKGISAEHVAWSFSGVRALFDDGAVDASAVTRDYVLDLDAPPGGAPLLSAFGGKLTTYRRLAEHALQKLSPFLPGLKPAWTAQAALPGGDLPCGDVAAYARRLFAEKPFLGEARASRFARSYGTRAERLLAGITSEAGLGRDFGAGLTEAETTYLARVEWARSGEDVLWRRSKLGLRAPACAKARIDAFLKTI